MAQAFYRKWRPQQWDLVLGQEHIVQTLKNAVATDRVGHAYLFAGPRGTGKTTTARLLAKAVNCLDPDLAKRPCNTCDHCRAVNDGRFMDLIEIDAASNTSVEDVRDLRDKINFSPSQGRFKVYIIDEVHMLSTAAFNALLKTLEEPPSHAIFILATTEVHKIPATVLSRCQRHEFRRIPVAEITRNLQMLADQEHLSVEPDAMLMIARQATGSMRDAISLLDQLSSVGKTIDLPMAQSVLGTATSQVVIDLVEAAVNHQAAEGMACIHRALDAGTDPRQFARQVVDYLRSVLLVAMGSADQLEATKEQHDHMASHARAFSMPNLLAAIRAFNGAATDQRSGWHPGLALELAFAGTLSQEASGSDAPPAGVTASPAPPPAPQSRPPAGLPPSQPENPVKILPPASQSGPAAPLHSNAVAQSAPAPRPAAPASPPASVGAPSPASAAPASGSDSLPTGGVTLNKIMENWQKIKVQVKLKSPQTVALLNSCRPMGIKDNTLVLGFSVVLKSKMENGDNLKILQKAVHQVLGVNLQVTCMVSDGKSTSLPADLDVDSDGIVGTALRDLGGTIVDVQ
jgi:DNA polymerase III subunit gamma/tau